MTDPLFMQTRSASADGTLDPTPAERVSAPARGLVYQTSAILDDPDGDRGFLALRVNGFLNDEKIGLAVLDRLTYLGAVEPPAQYQVIVTVVRLGAMG